MLTRQPMFRRISAALDCLVASRSGSGAKMVSPCGAPRSQNALGSWKLGDSKISYVFAQPILLCSFGSNLARKRMLMAWGPADGSIMIITCQRSWFIVNIARNVEVWSTSCVNLLRQMFCSSDVSSALIQRRDRSSLTAGSKQILPLFRILCWVKDSTKDGTEGLWLSLLAHFPSRSRFLLEVQQRNQYVQELEQEKLHVAFFSLQGVVCFWCLRRKDSAWCRSRWSHRICLSHLL